MGFGMLGRCYLRCCYEILVGEIFVSKIQVCDVASLTESSGYLIVFVFFLGWNDGVHDLMVVEIVVVEMDLKRYNTQRPAPFEVLEFRAPCLGIWL